MIAIDPGLSLMSSTSVSPAMTLRSKLDTCWVTTLTAQTAPEVVVASTRPQLATRSEEATRGGVGVTHRNSAIDSGLASTDATGGVLTTSKTCAR